MLPQMLASRKVMAIAMELGKKTRNGEARMIRLFTLSVADDDLEALRCRLSQVRWPEKETVDDWSQGVPLEQAKALCSYWRDHYDLRHILQRDWNKLGPLLKGKIHIYCGDMDNLYLNDAVYLMEDFLRKTKSPFYEGEVDYGDRAEHCWNGDHEHPNHISRLRYNTMYLPKILKRIEQSAPPGTNVDLWKY